MLEQWSSVALIRPTTEVETVSTTLCRYEPLEINCVEFGEEVCHDFFFNCFVWLMLQSGFWWNVNWREWWNVLWSTISLSENKLKGRAKRSTLPRSGSCAWTASTPACGLGKICYFGKGEMKDWIRLPRYRPFLQNPIDQPPTYVHCSQLMCTHTHTHTHTCTHTHTHTHTHINTHTHTHTRARMHARTHTRSHACTHVRSMFSKHSSSVGSNKTDFTSDLESADKSVLFVLFKNQC